jgi:hypothetical protein
MRTKTLLLTAAVLTAGLAASVAQSVYSVNAVGYVNKSLVTGYNLISNPLNGTNNLLSTILPIVADGTFVLKWNATAQTFGDPSQYYDGLGWLPDTTVNPGEGIFVNAPAAATVTFVGEVPQGNLTNQISGNYSLLSHIVPQSISLANPSVNFPAQDGDFVLQWNPAAQAYFDPLQYYDGLGWLPSEPTPAVAEGFFFNTGAAAARSWGRSFSVN